MRAFIASLGCSKNLVDSELILGAYEKWGQDCSAMLLGDYAFAIWDSRKQVGTLDERS